MALSVRMALLICLGSIGGMSWIVQQFSVPGAQANSPAEVGSGPGGLLMTAGMSGLPRPAAVGKERVEWVRQFSRPSALEVENELNQTRRDALACLPPTLPPMDGARMASLPPLAYDAELVLVSAPPTEPEWAPESDDGPVLAAGAGDVSEAVSAAELKRYRVSKGDTPMRIVQREWKSGDRRLVDLLIAANPQVRQRNGRILIGEDLVIPDAASVQRVLAGGPAAEPVAAVAAATEAAPKTANGQWYTIQRNDSLASIAQRFLKDGRRWREIAALNSGLDPRKIVPGLRIKLPPVIRIVNG
jgi:hypothetical protein